MRTLLLALVTVLLFSGLALAQSAVITQKRTIGLPLNGINRKPKITLQHGLKIAEAFAKRAKIDLSSYFLSEARMIQYGGENEAKETRWAFHWVGTDKPVGIELWIDVSMDGKASRPFTM